MPYENSWAHTVTSHMVLRWVWLNLIFLHSGSSTCALSSVFSNPASLLSWVDAINWIDRRSHSIKSRAFRIDFQYSRRNRHHIIFIYFTMMRTCVSRGLVGKESPREYTTVTLSNKIYLTLTYVLRMEFTVFKNNLLGSFLAICPSAAVHHSCQPF